jgi:hypothetical protein
VGKLKLPVVKGKSAHWPKQSLCPICGKNKVLEPHSMALLSAGALLMDRVEDSGGPSDALDGFLELHWHGAHDSGRGKDRDTYCVVDIVRDALGGQADLYFCSTKCLREFLNTCVDELERKVAEARRSKRQGNTKPGKK